MVIVIKADGSKETFKPRKIIRTCLHAGASRQTAREIAERIEKRVRDGWTTHKIYQIILSELDKIKSKTPLLKIRDAISAIAPEKFEIYTKKLLESHGYSCEWNRLVKGKCVEHQVDVIAKKENLYLVECKHHVNPHRFCGLGIVLQVQARLEDVIDGFAAGKNKYNFDGAWVFNNTKFSHHAKQYASAKNIILTGWGYKGLYALDKIVGKKDLYPVTILKIGPGLQKRLIDSNIITLHDFISSKKVKTRLKMSEYTNISKQIQDLLE